MSTPTQSIFQVPDVAGETLSVGSLTVTNPSLTQYLVPLHAPAGSTGRDWSVNHPAPPLIGLTTFGGMGPYASWGLIQTVPANFGVSERYIRNESSSPVLVVLDDGVAQPGSSPVNSHAFLLSPSSAQEGQFSPPNETTWRSERFKGRIRIFCPDELAWVAIFEA